MTNTNTAAIESLRNFAAANNELAFAHLCNAALAGEEWAAERASAVLRKIDGLTLLPGGIRLAARPSDASMLAIIRTADTARPDGAIARSISP